MKSIKYIGTGTGPALPAGTLSTVYDFSASPVQELSDVDARTLLMRCGHSFKDVTEDSLATYVTKIAADTTVPVLATAIVIDKTLTLTYTEAGGTDGLGARLNADIKPRAADFAVLNAGAANAVKKIVIAGKTVTLTLTNTCVHGATVTIGYTQVAGREIQDVKGNKAADLSAQAVTNSSADVTPPVLSTLAVDGTSLVLTYTDTSNLDATNKALPAAFTVLADDVEITVNANTVSAAGKTCTLTLASAVTAGQVVTCAYVPGTGTNSTRDAAGNIAAGFDATSVTNNTA